MKTIYLIRHGKATLEGSDRERGLTEEGIRNAEQLAEKLKNLSPPAKSVFASPFQRAILFIKPFADQQGLSVSEIENFREIKLSSEPIENLNEARQQMWSDFSRKLPGGESGQEAQDRGLSAFNEVLGKTEEGTASAVVSHGNLLGLIINSFDNSFGFEQWKSMTMPDLFQIDIEQNKGTVKYLGCGDMQTFQIA